MSAAEARGTSIMIFNLVLAFLSSATLEASSMARYYYHWLMWRYECFRSGQ